MVARGRACFVVASVPESPDAVARIGTARSAYMFTSCPT